MAITEKQALNIILDKASKPGERENAVSFLYRVTGKDRDSLVTKYLKAQAARRSTSKRLKAEIEEENNELKRILFVERTQAVSVKNDLAKALTEIVRLQQSKGNTVTVEKVKTVTKTIYSAKILLWTFIAGIISGSFFSSILTIVLLIAAIAIIGIVLGEHFNVKIKRDS